MMVLAFLQAAADAGTDGPADLTGLLADPEVAAAVKALIENPGTGPLATLGASLYLANLLIRKGALSLLPGGKVTDFLKTKQGGWAVNIGLAVIGGVTTAIKSGTPISFSEIGTLAAKVLLTSAVALMAAAMHKDTAAAKAAGKAAAENDDAGPSANA